MTTSTTNDIDLCQLARDGWLAADDPCLHLILVGDSGSTRTAAAVTVVDHCHDRVDICEQYHALLSYVNESHAHHGMLSDHFITRVASTIDEILFRAINAYPSLRLEDSCFIATAGLRHAQNSAEAAEKLVTMMPSLFYPVSQRQEAIIAFHGAMHSTSKTPEEVLVMDLGGASKQLVWVDAQGDYLVAGLQIASATFLHKIQRTVTWLEADVYPLSADQLAILLSLAHEEVRILPPVPTDKHVIGGGAHKAAAQHYVTLLEGASPDYYTALQLAQTLTALSGYQLAEVMKMTRGAEKMTTIDAAHFAKLDLAGMILILASLRHLGIDTVHTGHDSNLIGLAAMECQLPKK
jgi:hypothetical protein